MATRRRSKTSPSRRRSRPRIVEAEAKLEERPSKVTWAAGRLEDTLSPAYLAKHRSRGAADEACKKHFAEVPPGMLDEKGKAYGGRRRAKMIEDRFGVPIHPRTVMRKLADKRQQTS